MGWLKRRGRIYYRFWRTDSGSERAQTLRTRDKRVAARMFDELESKEAQRRSGLLDERLERYATAKNRKIGELFEEYLNAMRAKRRTQRHVEDHQCVLARAFDAGDIRELRDLNPASCDAAVNSPTFAKLSPRSRAKVVAYFRQFGRWLQRTRYTPDDPTLGVSSVRAEPLESRRRRALDASECQALLDAARHGPIRCGLTGLDRSMLWELMLVTGFRVSEIETITPESFSLALVPARLTLPASATKNRKAVAQPLPTSRVAGLKSWLANKPDGIRLFQITPTQPPRDVNRSARESIPLREVAARMLRADAEAAGIAIKTADGVLDAHALRATFATLLLGGPNLSLADLKSLMRHSDPAVTLQHYARTNPKALAERVDAAFTSCTVA